MRRINRAMGFSVSGIAGALLLAACGPDNAQNSLKPKGKAAQQIQDLFIPVVIIAVIVFVVVAGIAIFSVIRFRSRPNSPEPVQVHGNTRLEIGWTLLPLVILAVVSVFSIRLIFVQAKEPAADALQVRVVGKQWWWQFEYLKQTGVDQAVVTANELRIPTNRDIALELRACEGEGETEQCNVIHSFWIPELAGKTDVVPGRTNRATINADKPGEYLGQCAEYCGLSHANMRMRVIAQEPDDFDAWLAEQQKPAVQPLLNADGSPAGGEGSAQQLIAQKYQCVSCHTFDNSSVVNYGPNLTHFASRSTFASGYFDIYDRKNPSAAPDPSKPNYKDLRDWVRDAPSLIPMSSKGCRYPPGVPNTGLCVGMPSFDQQLPLRNAEGEIERDAEGNVQYYPRMTPKEAETIVNYLLGQK